MNFNARVLLISHTRGGVVGNRQKAPAMSRHTGLMIDGKNSEPMNSDRQEIPEKKMHEKVGDSQQFGRIGSGVRR